MLKGKTALITGGARGIGGPPSPPPWPPKGANVAVIYAGSQEKAEALCAQCAQDHGVQAQAYQCDVADFAAAKAVVAQVKKDFGAVDVLVNNAGITQDGLLAMMKEESFDRVLDVDLKGAFNFIRHCTPLFLRQKGGAIVNITSVSGMIGNPGQANYAAAKAGLIGLTKAVAKELAPKGITCNAVAPGFIATDMTRDLAGTGTMPCWPPFPWDGWASPKRWPRLWLSWPPPLHHRRGAAGGRRHRHVKKENTHGTDIAQSGGDGPGAITPVGNTVEEMWANLKAGVHGIAPITLFDTTDYKTKIGAEVKNFDPRAYMDKTDVLRSDAYAQYGVAAACQAVEESGIKGTLPPERVAVYFGSGIGGIRTFHEEHNKLLARGPKRISPYFIPMLIGNMAAGMIAIRFNCRGLPCRWSPPAPQAITPLARPCGPSATAMPTR